MAASEIRIVVAGSGFTAIHEHLTRTLPGLMLHAIEPDALRRDGSCASVLIPTMSRIDGEMMDRITGLRLIQQWGAGLEGVDLAAAQQRGIAVANVPSAGTGNAASVAEWCVMAAIALSRNLPELDRTIREGSRWGGPMGRGLRGRTAGILGLGGIGRELVPRLAPFGMRLIGLKREANAAPAAQPGLDWIGGESHLREFLHQTDYLFLCLHLNSRTRGLIGKRELAFLPAGACIINPARGALIDEEALIDALATGHLSGAALDVFAQEPLPSNSRLLQIPSVIATPHIAGVTDISYSDIARAVAENVTRLLSGAELKGRVV